MLNIIRGDTKYYKFKRINKLDGNIITTIPDKMCFTVKFDYNVEDVLIQKTLDNEIKFDEENSYYYFTILPEDTNNLPYGKYVYDIEITEKSKVTTIAIGEIELTEEVTFASNKENDGVNGEDVFIEDDEIEEIAIIEEYAPTTIINGDVDLSGVKHDIENLTELFKENQDNIINKFEISKPSNGLIKVNAITNKNELKEVVTIYNELDGKYPYSALAAQQGQIINQKLKELENRIQQLEIANQSKNEW